MAQSKLNRYRSTNRKEDVDGGTDHVSTTSLLVLALPLLVSEIGCLTSHATIFELYMSLSLEKGS